MKTSRLRAIANPVRLKLLTCIGTGNHNVTQLIDTCGLSQSAVSQHLRMLRRHGLVCSVKEGRTVRYRLDAPEHMTLYRSLMRFSKEAHS